jgi:predicted esterase
MRRLALVLLLGACSDSAPTTALFAIPGGPPGDDFYALPFPNDLWRTADNHLDLSQFPTNSLIVDTYRQAAQQLDGFGLNEAIYLRFDGPLDPTSLPDAATSMTADASVYLVNLDASSPDFKARTPIAVKFRADPTATLGGNHIVARPFPGFGLADGTTYALVVTDRIRDAGGGRVAPAASFAQLLGTGGDQITQDARGVYAPLLDYLDAPDDDERADVVSAAVFTTQHATSIIPAIRKAIFAAPAPVGAAVTSPSSNATFKTFTGTYMAPNLQVGDPPYHNPPEGEIRVDTDGAAVVQRMEPMRFALTVPPGATPAGGFPIAIYAHGTGGDYVSFIDDGTAGALALEGIAVISTDQVLHGPRNPGGNPELDFFNIANPFAMRDNSLQGAADAFAQLRLAQGLSIADGARTIKFNPAKVFFFGHSQGGLTGPGFVAFEPSLSGAVMSGTGGLLYLALLYKTAPIDIPMLVQTFLRDDPVDEDNPSLALFQMWAEREDGANYAPLMVRHPGTAPDGSPLARRNVFQTEGFTDTFTPNLSIEAFATALGGDIASTVDEKDVAGLTLRGRSVMPPPFSGNLDGATAVLAQYKQQPGSDGHFVVFDIPAAQKQASGFLGTLARTGTATVVVPN